MQSTAARTRALFSRVGSRPPVLPAHVHASGPGAFGTSGAAVGPVTATVHAADSAWCRYVHEVAPTPFGIRVLFGDASGTPQAAAETAAQMLRTFRAEASGVRDLAELSVRIAAALPVGPAEAPASGDAGGRPQRTLARLVLLEYRPDHALSVVNRGYPAPLLVAHSRTRVLEPPVRTPAIGVLGPGSVRPPVLAVAAYPGDRVLLQSAPRGAAAPREHFSVTSASTAVPVGGGAWCLVDFDAEEPRPAGRDQGRWISVAG
ncbi:SpoIIE family protein phosphatase [Yinghuangia soli]|uniref:Serine/threonine-protein phosphatase n=1 Tax=Yinghuangia soli TaxID=2908204 RepID=A0AA41Q5P8_9ACTN|nr:SpoIIE family protein phosphatase [Yinghuangia soli]MCF2532045.1 serine/threonine-protein phosphatase [Yinghuangia soli]